MIKNEIIKYWDDNICEGHLNSESSIVIDYFKNKGVTDIKYIDIGANVGKYYDVLSKHFNIKNCVMFEGSRILSDYLKTKFKDTPTIEVFNYAISNEDKLSYFSEETIEYFLNKDNLEGLNLGLSQISPNGGTPTQMRDIYGLLNESLLFASGKTAVEPKGVEALKNVAKVLEQNADINVLVEGHTDDIPMKGVGDIKDNWDLSVMRATSVTKILLQNSTTDPKRITSAGRGEFFPIDNAKTPEARKKNRRTEIILTPKLDELFKVLENN